MFDFSLERLIYVLPAIVFALTFHEYAHARVAYAYGDATAKNAGRLTLNPLRHLDPLGFILLMIAGFGWAKPVPVNPWYFGANRKRKMMMVSVAGPLTNLAEALVGAGLFSLLIHIAYQSPAFAGNLVVGYFYSFLQYFVMINAVLAVFNLLPVPPLDGSKILAGILPDRYASVIYQIERYGFVILMLLVFLPTILGWFNLPRVNIFGTIISTPAHWIIQLFYTIVGL